MRKILEYDGLAVGDIVLYNESTLSWTPAIVQSIHVAEKGTAPELALVVFVTGLHGSSFARDRAKHGKALGHWLTKAEVKAISEDPEKGRLDAERKHLAELKKLELQAVADLDKLTPAKRAEALSDPANIDPEGKPESAPEPEKRERPGRAKATAE